MKGKKQQKNSGKIRWDSGIRQRAKIVLVNSKEKITSREDLSHQNDFQTDSESFLKKEKLG